jgi:hypothetical protein
MRLPFVRTSSNAVKAQYHLSAPATMSRNDYNHTGTPYHRARPIASVATFRPRSMGCGCITTTCFKALDSMTISRGSS